VNHFERAHMRRLVEQLRQLEGRLREGGELERATRQHNAGKLTARERIALLLDRDAPMLEIGLLLGKPGQENRVGKPGQPELAPFRPAEKVAIGSDPFLCFSRIFRGLPCWRVPPA
jgi:hypothetical protein